MVYRGMKTAEYLPMLSTDELSKIEAQIERGQVFACSQSGQRSADAISYQELIRQRRAKLKATNG